MTRPALRASACRLLGSIALAMSFAEAAAAQSAAQPTAPANTTMYRSAFDGYRPWSDAARGNWRAANDEAFRLGGHAGHLRGRGAAAAESGAGTAVEPGSMQPHATPRGSEHQGPIHRNSMHDDRMHRGRMHDRSKSHESHGSDSERTAKPSAPEHKPGGAAR